MKPSEWQEELWIQTFQVFESSLFPGKREAECVREKLPTYLSTAPMVKPGGRVVGRSLSEWTTRSTLWRTSRKLSRTGAPLYLQLCGREKRHLLPEVSKGAALEDEDGLLPVVDSWKCKAGPQRLARARVLTQPCEASTLSGRHSLVLLQSDLQLFGEQALLSNLEKQRKDS